jgi:plasmid stabilization system protein ParE
MTAPTYRVIISKKAAADLQSISDEISKDSPNNAAGMIERILKSIDLLEIFPHRTLVPGQNPKLKHPARSLPVDPYVVYFRILEESRTVRITQIRHGARRPPKRLG